MLERPDKPLTSDELERYNLRRTYGGGRYGFVIFGQPSGKLIRYRFTNRAERERALEDEYHKRVRLRFGNA